MKNKNLQNEQISNIINELGGKIYSRSFGYSEGIFDNWRFRILNNLNIIEFSLRSNFDRWANSKDFISTIPKNEEHLLALLYWVVTRGRFEIISKRENFIPKHLVSRIWKLLPNEIKRDFKIFLNKTKCLSFKQKNIKKDSFHYRRKIK